MKRRLKKARIELKNSSLLFDFDKLDIICVDSKFLIKNYDSYVQNIYKAGIRIAVIGEGDLEETINIVNEAGILTVLNSYGTGFRTWGNRSAAFPSSSLPTFASVLV